MSDEMDKFELELKDPEKALWVARKTFSRRQVLAGAAGAAAAAALAGTVLAQVVPDDTTKVQGLSSTDVSRGRSPFEQPKRRVGSTYAGIPQTSSTNQANFMGVITPSDMHFERHHAGIPQIDPKRYKLLIHGMVERPMAFTLDDLKRLPQVSYQHFVECSGDSSGHWTGLRGTDATGPLTGVLKGLDSCGAGSIIGADGKEGWAWPYP